MENENVTAARYHVSYTVLSGPETDLRVNGMRTFISTDDKELAERKAAHLRTREGAVEIIQQLQRESEFQGLDLRIQDITVREVER